MNPELEHILCEVFFFDSTHCPTSSVSFIPAVVQLAWLLSLIAIPVPHTAVELLLWGATKRLAAAQTL